jgi:hypothetical protein
VAISIHCRRELMIRSNDEVAERLRSLGRYRSIFFKNDLNSGRICPVRISGESLWVPVYIGQGDLSKRATTDHHRIRCIDSKGATHVHLQLNAKKDDRLAEEQDLLANYTNALMPEGCNVSSKG